MNTSRMPWYLLFGRSALFAGFQALIALGFAAAGVSGAWGQSAAWWPVTVTLTNLVCLYLMARAYRAEGCRYRDLFRVDSQWKRDMLPLLAVTIISGPFSMLPNTLIATALYGDPLAPMRLFLSPLPPLGMFFALALFPITQGLVELPLYFLYVMPRISQQIGAWKGYLLSSLFLGFQHAFIPLRFDGRFFLWRLLMFVPFALLSGAALRWRPRLIPYMVVIHILMDFFAATMYLTPF